MQNLIPVSVLAAYEGEPRIRDLDLAEKLEFERPHELRRLVERNRDELEMHGGIFVTATNNDGGRGRPGKAYWLNEGQALVICALSRTEKAAQIRKALIEVFQAYRNGKLVHVKEHRRREPARAVSAKSSEYGDLYEMNMRCLRAFHGNSDARDQLLAGLMARVELMERRI